MVEERESVGDQNCPAGVFSFVFQETSDDDFCQTDYVPSNPSGQLVEECEMKNMSIHKCDPTVDARDMTTGELLVPSNSALLSSRILHCLSPPSFFFFELVAFCYFKGIFSPHYIYFPHLYIYVFYFIFHVNYPVCFYLNC